MEGRRRGTSLEAVLEAAGALFGEKGFHETSTDDLAAFLGISKPTLYKHCTSKAAILQKVVARHHERLIAEAHAISDRDGQPLDQLHELFLFQSSYVIKYRSEMRVIEGESRRLPEPSEINQLSDIYLAFVKRMNTSCQRAKVLRDDVPLEILARSFAALALWPSKWFEHRPSGLTEEDVTDGQWRLFVQGAGRPQCDLESVNRGKDRVLK